MINLLKTEIKKFQHNKAVRLIFILFTVAFPFLIFLTIPMLKDAQPPFPSANDFLQFPNVWDFQGYIGSWMVFALFGFAIIHMYTSEVRYKTLRQNILTGYTKQEFFKAKVAVVFSLALYATLVYTISTILIGMIYTKGFSLGLLLDSNWAVLRFFINAFGMLSFAFLCSVVFRSSGISIFSYYAYVLLLEPIARAVALFKLQSSIANYLPLNILEDNMLLPFWRLIENFINISNQIDFDIILDQRVAGVLGIALCFLFNWMAWRSFDKSDI